jgi:Peptidase family S41
MRGQVNTKAKLTILRKGQARPMGVSFIPEATREPVVRSRLENDVGYIRITEFSEQTTERLRTAINTLNNQAGEYFKGFIIDLRNNPGGYSDQAATASDAFLEKGEIVAIIPRDRDKTQRYNARPGELTKRPIIVLINGGSVGGSEIMAGALQDHRRATILGTRSFGMGTVQKVFQLKSGNGALRLTTARSLTPSGRSIQAKGITPDIEVLQDVPDVISRRTRSESFLRGHLKGDGQDGMNTMARGRDVTHDYGGAWRYAAKNNALMKRPKAHSLGGILVEHIMVENCDDPESIAANLGKDQVIGARRMPALFEGGAEMEVMIAHDIQQEILIRPSILGRGTGRTRGRRIASGVRLNRQVRGQVIAPPHFVEEVRNGGSMGRPAGIGLRGSFD